MEKYQDLKKEIRRLWKLRNVEIFFSMRIFFHEHSRITGLQGKGKGISLTPHYHLHTASACHSHALICLSYVLVLCQQYLNRMYLYIIRMSFICQSYEQVCHPYVTRMWFYHEPSCSIFLLVTIVLFI